MYSSIINKLKDKNICILGFGKEGISTYEFIRRHLKDKFITILDKKDISNLDILNGDKNIKTICGDNYLENLEHYDLIIKTPGISFNNINIESFKTKITSQLELTLEVFKNNIIGITGTKGKSTTSSLMHKILKDNNIDTYLLGNISIPIFDYVEKFKTDTLLVIEMSSHQLEYTEVSPHIGIVLNLYEDHLDHSGTVEHYHQNKMNIIKYQNSNDIGIYCFDNENTINQISMNKYLGTLFSVTLSNNKQNNVIHLENNNIVLNESIICNKDFKRTILGDHNLLNIMFCLVVAKQLNLDMKKVFKSIETFSSLEHRMELVGTYDGVTYYNDSIATIPEATIHAINTLKNVDTLIFGGMDRGINYDEFINYLKNSNINNLICMPTTGYKIGKRLEDTNKNIYYIEQLEEAVKKAKEITKKGKICLMSPSASSYEYYKNFEEKGKKYKELVSNGS